MKPGPKPRNTISTTWSPSVAYAVGLITADGSLSKDGRHLDFTSKDKAQVILFKKCLGLKTKVSHKFSGAGNKAYHTQFGSVLFYRFLLEIGLTPAKSKTLGPLVVPRAYFVDFLRGYFDGDGCSFSYFDPLFKNSFRFYISFTSASPIFIEWLRQQISDAIGIQGYLSRNRDTSYIQLKYSKREALLLSRALYKSHGPCLRRKYLKIMKSMRIIERRRDGEIGKHAAFRSQ